MDHNLDILHFALSSFFRKEISIFHHTIELNFYESIQLPPVPDRDLDPASAFLLILKSFPMATFSSPDAVPPIMKTTAGDHLFLRGLDRQHRSTAEHFQTE